MAKKPIPTPEELRKLLRYEPEAGRMYWRERTPDMFAAGNAGKGGHCKTWNTRYANNEAFTANRSGYKCGAVFMRMYQAHRVIWAMHYGEWPDAEIDHINHDRLDNRINNLRIVSRGENSKNLSVATNNSSGHVGVYWYRRDGKWAAQIQTNGCSKYLGMYLNIDDAIDARKSAEIKYGFHKNHGT